jgi:predicted DNA-binding transcriptional regulator YafY
MDRTERLLALMDALRRNRRPVTAAALSVELGVSVRTIYRDIQALIGLGAPIDGEAGLGYILRPGFFLPPLMFSEDELEALVLGARWVRQHADEGLAKAATNALAKIAAASPEDKRDEIAGTGLWVAPDWKNASRKDALKPIREAIRRERKVEISYVDESGASTERTVWPIALAFLDQRRLMVAWCELRSGFRQFRADRISAITPTEIRYPTRRAALVKAWQAERGYSGTTE